MALDTGSRWWLREVKLSSGACRAILAICCCRVETLSDLGVSVIFPFSSSVIRRSLPSAGSLQVGSPASSVLWSAPIPCRPSRHASCYLAWRYRLARLLFAPVGPLAPCPRAWGLVNRSPHFRSLAETTGPPRFLGNPLCPCPALRPRRDLHARPLAALQCCLPLLSRRRLPPSTSFGALPHGLVTRCLRFAAWVTPGIDARLASDCWPGFIGRGWLPAGFHYKVSEILTSRSPCPGLSWRTRGQVRALFGRVRGNGGPHPHPLPLRQERELAPLPPTPSTGEFS